MVLFGALQIRHVLVRVEIAVSQFSDWFREFDKAVGYGKSYSGKW